MKRFLINIGLFICVAVAIVIVLVLSTTYYTKQTFDFRIDKGKNILVVGNSHPECAINDSLLPNVLNLAQSGTGYFYDYLKVHEITDHNTQIDTVVIGYSYGDLAQNMDSWFDSDEKIKYKLPDYFFLLRSEDYFSLLRANPFGTLLNTPQTIFHNLKMKDYGYKFLGGFKSLKANRLKKAKELIPQYEPKTTTGYSQYQSKYLIKLYEDCISKDITLILLNTPIHPMLEDVQKPLKLNYCRFAKEHLPNALLVNHSNFNLSENSFRDMGHLRYNGAKTYTEFLRTNRFRQSLQSCSDTSLSKLD